MRYFFDLNGIADHIGTVLESQDAVPQQAFRLLLEIAGDSPSARRSLKVVVRDRQHSPVYEASLQLQGHWRAAAAQL